MSRKSNFDDGIVLNADHGGLLSVDDEQLIHIIKKEPIANVYHVEQTPFARGKFAAVRKCTHMQTGVEYAAKFIRKRRRAMDQRKDIVHEIAVLRLAADNLRIVRLHEVYETQQEMALVLELASGGELQTVLDVQDGLQEPRAVEVMKQILEGLSFLHDRNIAHLDLKPQNLLLTGAYPDCDVKLCDFGISRVIQSGIEVREILGTPDYVAPEILSYEPITLATDIWSVGVLAYVLLTGFSPFGGDNKQETFLNISQCSLTFPDELFDDVSPTAKDFIRATLRVEPKKRLTARQCLEHPWFRSTVAQSCRDILLETELVVANQLIEMSGIDTTEETGRSNGVIVQMSQDFIIESNDKKVEECQNSLRMQVIDSTEDSGRINGVVVQMSQDFIIDSKNKKIEECSNSLQMHGIENGYTEESRRINGVVVQMSQDFIIDGGHKKDGFDVSSVERVTVHNGIEGRVNEMTECGKIVADYKERRMVVEMSQEADCRAESDEDLPVNKRPKNCEDGCCTTYPVTHCCNRHVSMPDSMTLSVASSPVDRPVRC